MPYETLDPAAVEIELSQLDGWDLASNGASISRSFAFGNFIEAFGFMAECALVAEKLNHHPDWSNSYSKVHVTLTTHVTKCLTDRDFKMAKAMDAAFSRRN
jgi:4a-hydroxytetrahydrobiopterin dehydratase